MAIERRDADADADVNLISILISFSLPVAHKSYLCVCCVHEHNPRNKMTSEGPPPREE